jgi:LacI family transcriptional regulator
LAVALARGYTPNGIARGLVRKQTHSIGLIIPDISNPFFPQVASGVEDGAKVKGYSVFLCNTNYESDQEARYLQLLIEKRVDGIILSSGFQASGTINPLLMGSISIVSLCTRFENVKNSFVVIDNERGGFIATKHLIEQGYPAVGFNDIFFASFPEIDLTTVRQPKYEMGKLAANILLDSIIKSTKEPKNIF